MRILPALCSCVSLALVALAALGQGAGTPHPDPLPFSHAAHVPDAWWSLPAAEQPRDCRGCHDYSRPASETKSRPIDVCARCHASQEIRVAGTAAVDPTSESLFDHYAHRSQGCYECHAPARAGWEIGKPTDSLPVPAGRGNALFCARCHDQGQEAADVRGALNERIDRFRSQGGPGIPSLFNHSVHLDRLAEMGERSCEYCHDSLQDADAHNLGEKQFSVDRCKTCHAHEEDGFVTELVERPSRTAATFVHHYHLRPGAAQKNAEMREQGCLACHAYDEEARTYGLADRFAGDAHDGCVSCHQHADLAVEGHGNTDDCRQCHDISSGTIEGRPMVEVERPMPTAFRIEAQRHRFITGEVDQDCAKCHLAGVEALPSRVRGRSFDHLTHLSSDPSRWRGECHKCHQRMSEAVRPADIDGRDLFEWSHCADCHATDEIFPVFEGETARRVPNFSHDLHLRESLDCLDCHVSDPHSIADGIGLKADAARCTQCHGHEQHPENTPHDLETVRSCARCHGVGVPSRGEPVLVERRRFIAIEGDRKHPPTGACSGCHVEEPRWKPVAERDITIVKRFDDPHTEREIFNEYGKHFEKVLFVDPAKGGERGKWCIDCHWNRIERTSVWLNPRRMQEWSPDPQRPGRERTESNWREAFGDWLEGYPGFDPTAYR